MIKKTQKQNKTKKWLTSTVCNFKWKRQILWFVPTFLPETVDWRKTSVIRHRLIALWFVYSIVSLHFICTVKHDKTLATLRNCKKIVFHCFDQLFSCAAIYAPHPQSCNLLCSMVISSLMFFSYIFLWCTCLRIPVGQSIRARGFRSRLNGWKAGALVSAFQLDGQL